jgi:diketogulonate reductase-like aldo/keto reductase
MRVDSRISLRGGVEIPRLGLGVYQIRPGRTTQRAVLAALECGYRHIDTAGMYGNERDVGQTLRESGIPRRDVFVTTKLWNDDHGKARAERALQRSLDQLGLHYVDLYLIHWPVPRLRAETWKALCAAREKGLCRAIGVSNYTVRHLEELLASGDEAPAVNQVEFHPFLYQRALLEFCRGQGIALEAYSPLTRGRRLRDRRVLAIAERHGKSPAQVLIRWALEHGLVVIPKSARPDRIAENADVFDFSLSPDERAALDGLDEGLRTCWDPTRVR